MFARLTVALALLIALVAVTVGVARDAHVRPAAPHPKVAKVARPPGAPAPIATPTPLPDSPDIGLQAAAAVLMDQATGRVLWDAGAGDRRAPASLTKLITVMVALGHAPLTEQLTVPEVVAGMSPSANTLMGLAPGEVVSVRELLYGIFLASGNDAAETLASAIIPRDRFIAEMNQQVRALGLVNTNFVNPTGLDAPGQYSTAYDLAVITRKFVERYPDLLAISSLTDVALYADAGHPEIDLVNLNKLVLWPYAGATGLKTGFTRAAGGCVAATATRDGRSLIAIVLGDDVMFTDAAKLFDWGWGQP
jgi:D-alanyl-D-alanine carboxypeptidase (penicillin-binding protein 5/6)